MTETLFAPIYTNWRWVTTLDAATRQSDYTGGASTQEHAIRRTLYADKLPCPEVPHVG